MITSSNVAHLTRSNVWSNELKEILRDELLGQGHVRWLPFEGGNTTLNIPSIGDGTVRNYVEDTPVVYDSIDTGNFTFSITEYVQSGNYITEKARQDLFYAAQLEAAFVPNQARALAERVETDIYKLAMATGSNGGQAVSDLNTINGGDHRWVAAGVDKGTNQFAMGVADFARALFSLKKANVPATNLIALVDPTVEYTINTLSNLIIPGATTAPMWGDLLTSGIGSGPRFVRNIFGFDIYVTNYLCGAGAAGAGIETIDSRVMASGGVCNIFMSAADQSLLPFVGSWGQMPKVDSEYNKDFQREEYVTTARYGLKVYRPENLIVVLTNNTLLD